MTSMWVDDPDVEVADRDDSETEELFGGTNWVDCQAEWEDCNADCEAEWEDSDAECEECKTECVAALAECLAARARRRRARRPSKAGSSAQRATATAVRKLDLDTKVRQGAFHRTITAQNKRMSLSEYAAVAGAAVNQFIESFDAPENPYARAALRFSPLLLLSPQPKGRGVEGIIKDPRVIGAAAVAGLVFAGENRNEARKARDIRIFAPDSVVTGEAVPVVAAVVDGGGAVLPAATVTWDFQPPGIVAIDAVAGTLKASGIVGPAVISATFGDIVRRHLLMVINP